MATKRSPNQNQHDLLNALSDTPDDKSTSGFACSVDRIRQTVNVETRTLIDQRIEEIRSRRDFVAPKRSGGVNCSWLARVLTENGYTVSAFVVQNHVGKRCRCGY
jgi:hypothetical protein